MRSFMLGKDNQKIGPAFQITKDAELDLRQMKSVLWVIHDKIKVNEEDF